MPEVQMPLEKLQRVHPDMYAFAEKLYQDAHLLLPDPIEVTMEFGQVTSVRLEERETGVFLAIMNIIDDANALEISSDVQILETASVEEALKRASRQTEAKARSQFPWLPANVCILDVRVVRVMQNKTIDVLSERKNDGDFQSRYNHLSEFSLD